MSRELYKPVPCKQGCGKDVVWERDVNGKWLPPFEFDVENWFKLERHMCPNYKPQAKPFEKRGEGTNWTGTNKQGQFIQARESNEQQQKNTELNLILKKLDDHTKLLTQILLLLKTPFIEDPKTPIKEGDRILEERETKQVPEKEDEYGF